MKDTFTTPIVNSKTADKHFEMIKARHAEIINGLNNQAVKVDNYNKNKVLQDKQDSQEKAKIDQERMTNEMKNKELEIKKMALTL